MGNETEKMKVMNAHAEEVARIEAMNEETKEGMQLKNWPKKMVLN